MASPKLRFKEFDGDWNSVCLLEISSLVTKGTTPRKFVNGDINFLKIEAITENGFDLSKCQTINSEIHHKELKRSILKEGDILFAIAGATIGKNAIIQKELLPANTNQALAIVRLKEGYSNVFISKVLNSPLMEKYIDSNISTGAQPNLNLKQIGDFSFNLPEVKEQTKIASFLSAVDEKISQLTQKHELLTQYKQGMMQKLFSQQIRFKADDGSEFGEWEKKKLGELCSRHYQGINTVADKVEYQKDGYPILQAKHITSEKLDFEDVRFLSESDFEKYKDKYIPQLNDILFSNIGTIGKVVLVNEARSFFIAWNIFLLSLKTNITVPMYLATYLRWLTSLNYFDNLQTGNATKFINKADLLDTRINLPSLGEQTKIANFLFAIDQKIEVMAQQIEETKQWKKGLLQQMFV